MPHVDHSNACGDRRSSRLSKRPFKRPGEWSVSAEVGLASCPASAPICAAGVLISLPTTSQPVSIYTAADSITAQPSHPTSTSPLNLHITEGGGQSSLSVGGLPWAPAAVFGQVNSQGMYTVMPAPRGAYNGRPKPRGGSKLPALEYDRSSVPTLNEPPARIPHIDRLATISLMRFNRRLTEGDTSGSGPDFGTREFDYDSDDDLAQELVPMVSPLEDIPPRSQLQFGEGTLRQFSIRFQGIKSEASIDEDEARHLLGDAEEMIGDGSCVAGAAAGKLAGILIERGKLEEAEEYMKRAVQIHEESMGIIHPEGPSDGGPGDLLYRAMYMKIAEAGESAMLNCISQAGNSLEAASSSQEQHDALLMAGNLSAALYSQDQMSHLEKQTRKKLNTQIEQRGPLHPSTIATVQHWAMILQQTGRTDKAMKVVSSVWQAAKKELGEEDAATQSLWKLYLGIREAAAYVEQMSPKLGQPMGTPPNKSFVAGSPVRKELQLSVQGQSLAKSCPQLPPLLLAGVLADHPQVPLSQQQRAAQASVDARLAALAPKRGHPRGRLNPRGSITGNLSYERLPLQWDQDVRTSAPLRAPVAAAVAPNCSYAGEKAAKVKRGSHPGEFVNRAERNSYDAGETSARAAQGSHPGELLPPKPTRDRQPGEGAPHPPRAGHPVGGKAARTAGRGSHPGETSSRPAGAGHPVEGKAAPRASRVSHPGEASSRPAGTGHPVEGKAAPRARQGSHPGEASSRPAGAGHLVEGKAAPRAKRGSHPGEASPHPPWVGYQEEGGGPGAGRSSVMGNVAAHATLASFHSGGGGPQVGRSSVLRAHRNIDTSGLRHSADTSHAYQQPAAHPSLVGMANQRQHNLTPPEALPLAAYRRPALSGGQVILEPPGMLSAAMQHSASLVLGQVYARYSAKEPMNAPDWRRRSNHMMLPPMRAERQSSQAELPDLLDGGITPRIQSEDSI